MKTYFIKIDKKSITKNKDAGRTMTPTLMQMVISFSTNELHESFIDGKNCIIKSMSVENGTKIIKGEIISEELFELCQKEKLPVSVEITHEFEEHKHYPIPEYSFNYEDTEIVCCNCESKIKYSELKTDEYWDGEEEYYSNRVCPICNKFDCCSLEYESVEDALKRIK